MEKKHCTAYTSNSLRPQEDNLESNLRDWDLKARRVSHQNTNSRRFSASYVAGLKEDTCPSFRSNITISSTASSPGYPLKEEIDPSTYSFTTALKALQAKLAQDNRDSLSPEGFALNSKWNDAEKYICNPHSGQVPMECLSARSFRNLQSRITMSAPLVYSAKTRTEQTKASLTARKSLFQVLIEVPEKKEAGMARDVGIQSTEAEIIDSGSGSSSSSCLSPTSTPSIGERMSKRIGTEGGESPNSSSKMKSEGEDVEVKKGVGEEEDQVEEEEGKEESSNGDHNKVDGESDGKGSSYDDVDDHEEEEEEEGSSPRSRQSAGGWCLSWMRSRKLHQRDKLSPYRIKKPFFVSCTGARRS